MKFITILGISFFFLIDLFADTNNIEMVYDLNKSPEVRGFERQGKFNVNEFCGSANINIPLHKIVYKDIELQLNMNYNSRGVKVCSEASWVGLNWDLNIGGCVSVIPSGCFDYFDLNSRYQINEILNKKRYNDFYASVIDYSNEYSTNFMVLSELDFYYVALPNAYFYFFVDPETKEPTIIGTVTDSYKIIRNSRIPSSMLTKYVDSWVVKDGYGFTYEFTSIEKHNVRENDGKYNVAWLLTKITSAQGNSLNLTYSISNIEHLPSKSEIQDVYLTINSNGGLVAADYEFKRQTSFSNITRFMEKPYLSKIETEDQIVTFQQGKREDVKSAQKLESIIVKSKLTNKTIKTIKFNYSYFDSNNVGGDYLENRFNVDSKYISKRLKLLSIDFLALDGQKQQYEFEYEESKKFPQKTSSAVDMWGYYNGQENCSKGGEYTHTMIPYALFCDIPTEYVNSSYTTDHQGANRFANPSYTDALILKKITYPTKGYTTFQYESNSFMKYYQNVYASGRINKRELLEKSVSANSSDREKLIEINLDQTCECCLSANFVSNSGLNSIISQSGGCGIILKDSNGNEKWHYYLNILPSQGATSHSYTQKITLEKGKYFFTAKMKYGSGSVTGKIVASTLVDTTPREIETYGDGLRIKKIANYDQGGTLLESTEYKYLKEDNKTTSGIHINPSTLGLIKNILVHTAKEYTALTNYKILRLYSDASGMTAFASAMSPHDVCYSRVIKTVHTGNEISGKKEITNYSAYPLTLNLENSLCSEMKLYNGDIESKEYYDESNWLVRTEQYTYSHDSYHYYKVNAKLDNCYYQTGNKTSDSGSLYEGYCYSLKSCWSHLDCIKQIDYRYREVCNEMLEDNYTYTVFKYDSINKQISSKYISNLGATTVKQKTSYIYSHTKRSMNNSNFLNAIIQQTDSIYYPGGSGVIKNQIFNYSNPRNGVFLLSSVRDSIENGNIEERMHYEYDKNRNVSYILKDSTDKVVYLWSYNGSYPIAKIEGLTYSSVSDMLTTSFISNLQDKKTPSESDYNTIRTCLANIGGLITTYTYEPLVGVTSLTQPNGVKTIFNYDGFGRLVKTINGNGETISSINYHIKEK